MSNFIEEYWEKNKDLWDAKMVTRFPPEPNGLLHIGHAKSIVTNGLLAQKYGGKMHLRMDDTNPEKEDEYFSRMIEEIVQWLGFDYGSHVYHASDYFDTMHALAVHMIQNDLAYVDFTPKEHMRNMRGTLTSPGVRSADAERPISWHLDAFDKMKRGEYPDGYCALRAKLDMASPNMNLRDPVIYRIKHTAHMRTGKTWCIYPSYDFAHPIEDYLEGISLSLCTLEFEDHRPFYDYIVSLCARFLPANGAKHVPVELEFARLELDRGMTSKRKINALVASGQVDGFDDPRLLTLVALRRRGFTPSSLRTFCIQAGVSKSNAIIPFSRVEDFLRLDLDDTAPRRCVIARPVALNIEGLDAYETTISNHPKHEHMGTRPFALSGALWVDATDVRPSGHGDKDFKRIEPGAIVRIMPGLVIECTDVLCDDSSAIIEVRARISSAKPRATIHALDRHSAKAVTIWEPGIIPTENDDPKEYLTVLQGYVEPAAIGTHGTFHALRYGYCVWDNKDPNRLILSTALRSATGR